MNVTNLVTKHTNDIVDAYRFIQSLPELTITPDNMRHFSRFLDLLSNKHGSEFADAVVAQPAIQEIKPSIQAFFGQASTLYERHWAQRIVSSDAPLKVLTIDYPYYAHYQRATALEINAIQAIAERPVRKVLMVGSGALPLTSIALAKTGFSVDNLDISDEDLQLGQRVCNILEDKDTMNFIHADICQQTALHQYDVIWLAALVGNETLKAKIIHHLHEHMQEGALLVLRTACNLRTLLYPSVAEREISPFETKLKIQTFADNFHSIYIAQKVG